MRWGTYSALDIHLTKLIACNLFQSLMRWGTYSDMIAQAMTTETDKVSIAHALGNLFRLGQWSVKEHSFELVSIAHALGNLFRHGILDITFFGWELFQSLMRWGTYSDKYRHY